MLFKAPSKNLLKAILIITLCPPFLLSEIFANEALPFFRSAGVFIQDIFISRSGQDLADQEMYMIRSKDVSRDVEKNTFGKVTHPERIGHRWTDKILERDINFRPEISTADGQMDLWWSDEGQGKYVSAGFYLSEIASDSYYPNHDQFRDWLRQQGPRLYDVFETDDYEEKDFSYYISSQIPLTSKGHFQWNHYWSKTTYPLEEDLAIYNDGGMSGRLGYQVTGFLNAGLGYNLHYQGYDQTGYEEYAVYHTPSLDLTLTPFYKVDLLKDIAVKVYTEKGYGHYEQGEYYFADSRSTTHGTELSFKMMNVTVKPGYALRKEIADLNYPEDADIQSYYLNVSGKQKIAGMTMDSYVEWSHDRKKSSEYEPVESERFAVGLDVDINEKISLNNSFSVRNGNPVYHETNPKHVEFVAGLRYKLLGTEQAVFLLHAGYTSPLKFETEINSDQELPQANINSAFIFEF